MLSYKKLSPEELSDFVEKSSQILFDYSNKDDKLIDHIKTNKRIIAQQGAFILFQGNDYKKIPERISYTTVTHSRDGLPIQERSRIR